MNQIIVSKYNVDVKDFAEKSDTVENGSKVICNGFLKSQNG